MKFIENRSSDSYEQLNGNRSSPFIKRFQKRVTENPLNETNEKGTKNTTISEQYCNVI